MNRLPRLTWQVTVQSPHGAPPAPVSVTRKAKAADGDLETRRGAPEKPTATSPAAEQSGGSAAARRRAAMAGSRAPPPQLFHTICLSFPFSLCTTTQLLASRRRGLGLALVLQPAAGW